MNDVEAWGVAVTAVLTTVFGFFKWLLPFLREQHAARKGARVTADVEGALRKHRQLYAAMQALEDAGIQRSVIFAGHNGGGIPRPGTPFYVSALHWMVDQRDRQAPHKYQHLPVDAPYINLLLEVRDSGPYRFTTEDHAPGQLRDIYLAEGVTDALIVPLGLVDRRLLFMSAAVFEGELTDSQITEIKVQANLISDLICPPPSV